MKKNKKKRFRKVLFCLFCIILVGLGCLRMAFEIFMISGAVYTSYTFQTKINVDTLSPLQNSDDVVKSMDSADYICFRNKPQKGIYRSEDGKNFKLIFEVESIDALAARKGHVYFASNGVLFHITEKGTILEEVNGMEYLKGLSLLEGKLYIAKGIPYGVDSSLYVADWDKIETIKELQLSVKDNAFNSVKRKDGSTIYTGKSGNLLYAGGAVKTVLFHALQKESFLRVSDNTTMVALKQDGAVLVDTESAYDALNMEEFNGTQRNIVRFEDRETLPVNNFAIYDGTLVMLSQKWKDNGPKTFNNQMTNNHKCDTVNIINLETGEHKRGYESKPGERVLFADLNTMLTYYDGKIQCRKLGDLSLIYEEDAAYLKKPGSYSVELAVDRVFIYKNNDLLGNYAVR